VSRGLGHVALKLLSLMTEEPGKVFSTTELCHQVYPEARRIQKKHRVAVLRALRTLVARNAVDIWRFIPRHEKADVGWFNRSLIGRLKHSCPLHVPSRNGGSAAPAQRAERY
jgi:hypothetical protein